MSEHMSPSEREFQSLLGNLPEQSDDAMRIKILTAELEAANKAFKVELREGEQAYRRQERRAEQAEQELEAARGRVTELEEAIERQSLDAVEYARQWHKAEQERDALRLEAGRLRDALEAERENHYEDDSDHKPLGYCHTCGNSWPCESAMRIDEVTAQPVSEPQDDVPPQCDHCLSECTHPDCELGRYEQAHNPHQPDVRALERAE